MKFKQSCPSCAAPDKQIECCYVCGTPCCSVCSINKQCLDCFGSANQNHEVNRYFAEKQAKAT